MKKHWWIVVVLVLALAVPAVANQAVKIFVDGQELKSDVPAQIIDGRTMVPMRAVAEYFGKTVDWDQDTYTVTITGGMSELEVVQAISADWIDSGHANTLRPLNYSGGRDGCQPCHSGNGFSQYGTDNPFTPEADAAAGLEVPVAQAISCATCHTGAGTEIINSGVVNNHGDLPFLESYEAGKGALCMTCHTGRQDPVSNYDNFLETGNASWTHQKAVASIATGAGGMQFPDVEYNSSRVHMSQTDTCVSCHMPETEDGYIDHTFAMAPEKFDLTCINCHAAWGWDEYNSSGLKDKVAANLDLLEAAIIDAVDGAVAVKVGRSAAFTLEDGETLALNGENVAIEVYVAAYNLYLISSDPGAYVHNPKYVKSLLDESYKALTGETFGW